MEDVLLIGGFLDGCRFPVGEDNSLSLTEQMVQPLGDPAPDQQPNVTYIRQELEGWSESCIFVVEGLEVSDDLLQRHLTRKQK